MDARFWTKCVVNEQQLYTIPTEPLGVRPKRLECSVETLRMMDGVGEYQSGHDSSGAVVGSDF